MFHVLATLGNIDPKNDGLRIGEASIRVAWPNKSDPVCVRTFKIQLPEYRKTETIQNFCDTAGNFYEQCVVQTQYDPDSVYSLFRFLYEASDCKVNITNIDIGDAAFRFFKKKELGSIPYVVDSHCFVYLEIKNSSDSEFRIESMVDALRLISINPVECGTALRMDQTLTYPTEILYHLPDRSTSYEVRGALGRMPGFVYDETAVNDIYRKLNDIHERKSPHHDMDTGKIIPNDEKSALIATLLELYRLSFSVDDCNTSFVLHSMIWETFSQEFDKIIFGKKGKKDQEKEGASARIRRVVKDLLYSGENDNPQKIYNLVKRLYGIRSSIVHGDTKKDDVGKGLRCAFEVSRALILKLVTMDMDLSKIRDKINDRHKKRNELRFKSDIHMMWEPAMDELLAKANEGECDKQSDTDKDTAE